MIDELLIVTWSSSSYRLPIDEDEDKRGKFTQGLTPLLYTLLLLNTWISFVPLT